MKKLVGGVFLLSLLTLTLVQSVDGETYTSITDKNVLEQLTNLKSYINNPEMIKPVWVQLKNGDDIIVVQGQLSVVDDGEFDIDISIKGYTLTIHVEFTQATLEDSTPIDDWYIDTNDATYLFTSDAQNLAEQLSDFTGDVSVTGDLSVTGDATLPSINGEENPSVKPIYWHGLNVFKQDGGKVSSIQFHILNNDDTPINTIDKIKTWAESISGQVLIACNGSIPVSNVYKQCVAIIKSATNEYSIYYIDDTNGVVSIPNIDLADYFASVQDAINKLN